MNRNEVLIEADELLRKFGDKNLRVFDATITDDVYARRHIPGAAYFDHARFSDPASPYTCTILPEERLAEAIGRAGISNDTEVIVYACGMLPYAIRAWWVLRYAGHQNVRVLNGGLDAWINAGGQIEQEARRYEPATFTPRFDPSMFAGKEEVLASAEDGNVAIVDVLPLESYEASHIVGSVCSSCMDLMQGLDYLLPDDQLASRLSGFSKYNRIITYCGGGIAAAVNAAAHLIVGHRNVGVYDGSMFEWLGEKLPTVGTGRWEIWMQAKPEEAEVK
ncbi:MAG: rhodanese-like domain-containing protein [Chloroflexota bacterium]